MQAEFLQATGRVPRPLLTFEERFLLEDMQGDGFGGTRDKKRRLEAFNAAWARLQSDSPGWPRDPVDRAFHRELLNWLRFHEAMLIGELVPETLRFLRDNPAHRPIFEHVLVDEYQDLNKAEQVLIDQLAKNAHLTVIGDRHQSIYSFKYAHPDGIATFHHSHPNTHDESIIECRRCPKRVVEMANALISNNGEGTTRILEPLASNPEGEVYVVQWHDIDNEAQGIAKFIQRKIQNDEVEPGKVLVLAPRRQLGYAVRDALDALGVPVHSFFHEEALEGDPSKLDRSAAQQAFTLLTLLANPNDRVALRCWCGFGSPSLRQGAWARLREHCESTGESPRKALEGLLLGELSIPRVHELVQRFQELQNRLQTLTLLQSHALVDALFPSGEDWATPFRSLVSTIDITDFGARTLRDALRIGVTQPELPTNVDYVRVMSLHKSKGLTADLVVVLGCIEGLIPIITGDNPAERNASLEEQRRLFYVAITRTRRILVLSSITELPWDLAKRMRVQVRRTYRRAGKTFVQTIASRFLSELGPSRPEAMVGTRLLE